MLQPSIASRDRTGEDDFDLTNGSRIAVIGGGPAGSLFAYFLLDMAERVDTALEVDIYEPRPFALAGPLGCNMCGGIVSETLVQNLAMDGVFLSSDVIQRGIDSYALHTDVGSVRIATPYDEARIGAVHRGGGPRDVEEPKWESFDRHLLDNAVERGANVIHARVDELLRIDGRPAIRILDGEPRIYDLAVVATGVNTSLLKSLEHLGIGYARPQVTKTLIREYQLGADAIAASLGTSMHVFLLNIPRLEFAAVIPKGDYATMCLLGDEIDNALGDAFAMSPQVRAIMPADWDPEAPSCQCLPHINIRGVDKPYADRVVFIGDSGVTRLYKDGIGAAYRTAKAAARTVLFEGISERAFHDHFLPVCRSIQSDNRIGRYAFLLTRVAQRSRVLRRVMLTVARDEQRRGRDARLSGILWDLFSGSAPYGDIFRRMVDPILLCRGAMTLPHVLVASVRDAVERSALAESWRSVRPGRNRDLVSRRSDRSEHSAYATRVIERSTGEPRDFQPWRSHGGGRQEARRRELFALAAPIFRRHGFRGATIKALANACGLSPASLYHYFGSKEEMATYLVRRPRMDWDSTWVDPTTDPLVQLAQLLDLSLSELPNYLLAMRLADEIAGTTSDGGSHARTFREGEAVFARLVAESASAMSRATATRVARDALSAMVGSAILGLDPEPEAAIRERVVAILRSALVPTHVDPTRFDATMRRAEQIA